MNSIKLFLSLCFIAFNLTACMGTKAPITCSQLATRYNSLNKSIILNTARGYEDLTQYIFIYDSIYQFNEDIDTYLLYLELLKVKELDNPFTNRYCQHINNTIQENNTTIILKKFKEIKYSWTEDYIDKINRVTQKNIQFNRIDDCQKVASQLQEFILTFRINMSNDSIYNSMKKQYMECLTKNNKK